METFRLPKIADEFCALVSFSCCDRSQNCKSVTNRRYVRVVRFFLQNDRSRRNRQNCRRTNSDTVPRSKTSRFSAYGYYRAAAAGIPNNTVTVCRRIIDRNVYLKKKNKKISKNLTRWKSYHTIRYCVIVERTAAYRIRPRRGVERGTGSAGGCGRYGLCFRYVIIVILPLVYPPSPPPVPPPRDIGRTTRV